jgi:thioesterase domain-containing protein
VAQLNYFLAQGLVNKLFPEFSVEQLRHFLYLFKVNVQAMRNYKPSQYVGRILFLRAAEVGPVNPVNPERGWFDLATAGVEVVEVPGNHITMNYLPQVTTIAERLKVFEQI